MSRCQPAQAGALRTALSRPGQRERPALLQQPQPGAGGHLRRWPPAPQPRDAAARRQTMMELDQPGRLVAWPGGARLHPQSRLGRPADPPAQPRLAVRQWCQRAARLPPAPRTQARGGAQRRVPPAAACSRRSLPPAQPRPPAGLPLDARRGVAWQLPLPRALKPSQRAAGTRYLAAPAWARGLHLRWPPSQEATVCREATKLGVGCALGARRATFAPGGPIARRGA